MTTTALTHTPGRDVLTDGGTPGTLHVVVVNGSPSEKSKNVGLTEVVVDTLRQVLEPSGISVHASRIDVYRLGEQFTGALEREGVAPEVDAVLQQAESADLLIAATPVFRGSYTGLFKHFFDLVDQYALANTPVLLAATDTGHVWTVDHTGEHWRMRREEHRASCAVTGNASDLLLALWRRAGTDTLKVEGDAEALPLLLRAAETE